MWVGWQRPTPALRGCRGCLGGGPGEDGCATASVAPEYLRGLMPIAVSQAGLCSEKSAYLGRTLLCCLSAPEALSTQAGCWDEV